MKRKLTIAGVAVALGVTLSGCIPDADANSAGGHPQYQQQQYSPGPQGGMFSSMWAFITQPHPPLRSMEQGPQHWQRRVVRR